MKICPFIYSRTMKTGEFLNRQGELRRTLGRIIKEESTAIIGGSHIGKTSFLNVLVDKSIQRSIVGNSLEKCIFSFIDSHMIGNHFDQAAFWHRALQPLIERNPIGIIYDFYKTAEQNHFGNFTLEQLFCHLGSTGEQFILILDEFDVLLNHAVLNKAEFYGGLRALASRCSGFSLIIASRHSLAFLNRATQQMNPHSSPYFNIFSEIRLGAFPKNHAKELLARAGETFDKKDVQFLMNASGNHPYLLQMAASILWEINDRKIHLFDRYKEASEELYQHSQTYFEDTWNCFSNAEKKVLTAIALSNIPGLIVDRKYSMQLLIAHLSDYNKELRQMKRDGILWEAYDNSWRITQQAFIWWLADEIKRVTRDDTGFDQWLLKQEIDSTITMGERKQLSMAAKTVGNLLKKGATTLIETFAKGVAEGTVKAMGL